MQSGKTMDVEVDRLSNLPDDLIYKILSYVDMVYCIKLSALSSRWRFILTSMPNLNFDSHQLSRSSSPYHEFVNNVLSVRNNKIDVSSVSLRLDVKFNYLNLSFKRIIEYAFSHNVQQLSISIKSWGISDPSWLSSKSLKHLKVFATTIRCPSYSTWDLPALTTLHLNYVTLYNCSSILAMCQNLKNLTLELCHVYEPEDSNSFTIINSRLLSLTLKRVKWEVGFVLVDTTQLKNLIIVDIPQLENLIIVGTEEDDDDYYHHYGRRISDLSGVTISACDLTYLRIKGSYFPELFLDGFLSSEKVDLCISYPQETDVHKISNLFQCLHSVTLALNLEIVELLSTSEEVISHQPSPFPSLESLKIYPLEGLKTLRLYKLKTCPLKSILDLFPTQLDEKQEAMKIKLSSEVTEYLLDSSSNATFTMVSHEEARAIKITKVAYRLMADLWKILEGVEASMERKKTLDDCCSEDLDTCIRPWINTKEIFCILQNIKLLLTKVLASKRVEMQACFSRLSAKSKTVVNMIVVDMKNQCDIKHRIFSGYFYEIDLIS